MPPSCDDCTPTYLRINSSPITYYLSSVAEIKLTCGEGTDTPAQLQLVTRIPWKYGASVKETSSSWILVRVQAFVSKALFARPAQVIKLGRCALGFAEPSSGKDASCQLVGWDVVTPDERRSMSPLTMPSQFDLDFNRGVNFPHPYSPLEHGQCLLSTTAECNEF